MTAAKSLHTFHIPVMGLAYTIDSPIRVAQYGISSVISIMDDDLIEKMNSFYSAKFKLPYQETTTKGRDYRAERITSYLNLVDRIVKDKFINFKDELAARVSAAEQFIAMLPNKSEVKKGLQLLIEDSLSFKKNIYGFLQNNLIAGDIDVNIMTKLDKDNFIKDEQLAVEFNDAHAALRGFANSTLNSSVVLSAGMNPRLFGYFESFPDFFPDYANKLRKKIILKVSDFRSAMIQGNFLAKKGLWVSEYRIESGLNCGGHAFATDGYLLGPILEEFKQKKEQLISSAHDLMIKALASKQLYVPQEPLALKITVQGGVGLAEEHDFLLEHYAVNSVGWGSPFLLVPEATSVDKHTRDLLIGAKEEDLYLSHISPLGIPFNTIRGTTNESFKQKRIDDSKAGSSCPKRFLALSKEFDAKGICTSSKKYQDIKLEELESRKKSMSAEAFERISNSITEKACLCVGLANASYLEHGMKLKGQAQGVVICPGPNMAYFDQEVSLSKMVQHIYGNDNVLRIENRPNLFIKELTMYVDYLRNEIASVSEISIAQAKKFSVFKNNLISGIEYYQDLFSDNVFFEQIREEILTQLQLYKSQVELILIPVMENA